MYEKLSDIIAISADKEDESSFNLRATLNKYLYHWPLFLIGILICMLGAFFYLQKVNPVYTLTATVIIKDQKKEADEKNNLQELYTSTTPKLVENEIEVLKSRRLIGQVVSDLQLWINYQENDGMRTVDLYKKSPVILKLKDSSSGTENQVFKIKIKDNNSFYLKKDDGKSQVYFFN
ncbi:MAG: Wzz/FepE/Etk N-terminal domain-containing protein, partial [Thermoproteota archaeon]|nr:Wzz/FepE/Etk N-terminal domain-containing protein [Thermoproteota archaeon]